MNHKVTFTVLHISRFCLGVLLSSSHIFSSIFCFSGWIWGLSASVYSGVSFFLFSASQHECVYVCRGCGHLNNAVRTRTVLLLGLSRFIFEPLNLCLYPEEDLFSLSTIQKCVVCFYVFTFCSLMVCCQLFSVNINLCYTYEICFIYNFWLFLSDSSDVCCCIAKISPVSSYLLCNLISFRLVTSSLDFHCLLSYVIYFILSDLVLS